MTRHLLLSSLVVGCSMMPITPDGGSGGGGAGGSSAGGSSAGGSSAGGAAGGTGGGTAGGAAGGARAGGSTSGGSAGGATSGGSSGGGSTGTIQIATWVDAPGACPQGMAQRDITTIGQLEAATRGEGAFAADAPSTCYLIHNGTYAQNGSTLAMFVKVGGTDATHRRLFVGESRGGTVVRGRASIDAGVSHVRITNLTFTLTGFAQSGSFNTVSMLANSTDLRLDHLTFTGDCTTGANGGHVEVDGSSDVVVEDSLIEKFGRCGPQGHQDHGVYLASGSNLVIRNNEIRENASRGIQFNTQGGGFGTIDQVTIERNRIHHNGHADYEDGIVMNATGTGTISNVTIRNNVIDSNRYSGLRFVGASYSGLVVTKNTFFQNGTGSTAAGRSEVNLDDVGSGANAVFSKNLFVAQNRVLNDCYDSQSRGFSLADNKGTGALPSGAAGNCVSTFVTQDPMFVNPAAADFHPTSSAVNGYGAYTP